MFNTFNYRTAIQLRLYVCFPLNLNGFLCFSIRNSIIFIHCPLNYLLMRFPIIFTISCISGHSMYVRRTCVLLSAKRRAYVFGLIIIFLQKLNWTRRKKSTNTINVVNYYNQTKLTLIVVYIVRQNQEKKSLITWCIFSSTYVVTCVSVWGC